MKRALVSSLAIFLLASSAQSADRMRIAYSSISGAYVGIWVAHDAGFFAKEGLEDQIILIPSATQLAQVTVAGDVDVSSLGGGPMIAAALSGADLKIFGNNVNKMIFSLHTRPDVKIIEELRGKRIAVSRFGSSTDVSARYALRKHNLDPQKDVILMQLGSMSNMFGALKSGAVDASMVSPPTQFLSEKLGFKEILSVTDMNYAYPNPAMVTSGEMIRKKPDLIDRFMRAYVRAIHLARTDRESTIKTLAKYTTVTDPVLLGKTYDFYMTKVVERAPFINMAGIQNAIDDLARTLPAAKSARPEQFVDLRFLERSEKSGLLNELYR
ncbi:MAG TPA: ABC transporter substrate-binding protein [Methylomirabilota bacterium]|nr:ABC transporter substrate-binding protein [Methylomirabilota bacterium]